MNLPHNLESESINEAPRDTEELERAADSDPGEEVDIEFPGYLEDLKNEILQKVMARSSVRGIRNSRDSNEEAICRICYDDAEDMTDPPITMCKCKGSMGLVHVRCLEMWLNEKTTDTCELCHYKFNTKFEPTEPNIFRSMLKFIFFTDRSRGFPAPSCCQFLTQSIIVTFLLASFNLIAFSFVTTLESQSQTENSVYARYTSDVCVILLVVLINWLFLTLLIRETLTHYWIWYHWWLKTFSVKLMPSDATPIEGQE